jgi:elongation factor Ts
MTFTAKDVADLRQKTGAGMMECKKALTDANGDIEKASEILRQKGIVAAAKKADKVAMEGIVASKISDDKKSGVIIELSAQTDFVAKNELFIDLSQKILDAALASKSKSLEDLLQVKVEGSPLSELIKSRISTIGENIQLRRVNVFQSDKGVIGTYIHPVGNKIGVLVKLQASSDSSKSDLDELSKNIAMHIAASQPQPDFIDKSEIPANIIEEEKRIEMGKEDLAKKPKEIAEKIVHGRLDKLLAQRCLLEQPFIKDPGLTVEKMVLEKGKQLNIEIKVAQFIRYNVGETQDKSQLEEKEPAAV